MTAWMVRGGRIGEWETWALENGVAGGGFKEVGDVSGCGSRDDVFRAMRSARPDEKDNTLRNWAAQLWSLRARIEVGDIIVLPLKTTGQIAIGRCTAGYRYLPNDESGKRHSIGVDWVRTDVPRADLKQDLLFSLGAFMTICRIDRNGAEARLETVIAGGADPGAELPAPKGKTTPIDVGDDASEGVDQVDIEDVAKDAIRIRLVETFQSHQLAELTAAILRARGLTCVVSPPGPDKGVDIVAGSGPLGLDSPRIVVQCKSSASPMDITVIQRLQGAMGTLGAEQALLVAYGGVNKPASELLTNQQFKVKVWDVDDILNMLLDCYDTIDPAIREMIPLKNVWTLTNPGE